MAAVDTNASRRTFAQYKLDALFALGMESGDDTGNIDVGAVVNDALEHIVAMHEWNWLSTGEQSLDVVADQDYIELPADFGTLLALQHKEGWARSMIPTTWEQMLRMRATTIQNWSWSFWYVIQTGNVAVGDEDAGLDLPTLALYPTPADDETGAISLVYRRFIRRLTDDTDRPQWPAYMDRALSVLARAFILGDFDAENMPQTTEGQQFAGILPDLKVKDGLSRRSFGLQLGGLIPRQTPVSPFYPQNIPDPVLRT